MRFLSNVLKESGVSMQAGEKVVIVRETKVLPPVEENVAKIRERLEWRARADAHKIIEEAESYAQTIVRKAEEKARQSMVKAWEDGYETGLREGREKAEAEKGELMNELNGLIGEIEEQKEEILREYEQSVRELALAVAKKIIDTELQTNDEAFISLFQRAVSELGSQEWIKVSVSGDGFACMTSNAPRLKTMVKDAQHVRVFQLDDAPRGTLIVETASGVVDAGIDTQLSRVEEAFLEIGRNDGGAGQDA